MLTYDLTQQPGIPLYEALYRRIRQDILTGTLPPQTRLPLQAGPGRASAPVRHHRGERIPPAGGRGLPDHPAPPGVLRLSGWSAFPRLRRKRLRRSRCPRSPSGSWI